MTATSASKGGDVGPQEYPQAKLEKAFIKEYLASKGYDLKDIPSLPRHIAKALMTEASLYASTKLAEIETRSALVKELHEAFY
jgi:hypothetical protein